MAGRGATLRAVSARVVDAVVHHGRSLDAALQDNEVDVDEQDLSLLRMLCFGTLRNYFSLRAQLDAMLDKPLRRKDKVIESLLLAGLFQLSDTRIPDHAAVSETVEATRVLGRPGLKGLVNAILRRSRREDIVISGDEADSNHPQWLLDRLRADWPDDWQAIVAANNERAPMWLRVNARQQGVDEYLARLGDTAYSIHPALPQGVRLEAPMPVSDLPGFQEGDVSVQDGGAQLAALLCSDGQPRRILDACAAPGGKSAHLLELNGAETALTCIDVDAERVKTIRETLARLDLHATVHAADASNKEAWWDGEQYDVILLDAPCSATGVIRRHPDIKLLRRDSDIGRLSDLQGTLLRSLWPLLKPGGQLLYVTCSVLGDENERVVERFLGETADARENDVLQNNNIRDLMRHKAFGVQLLPGTAGMDGFYFASLERIT